jgi:hypothetical protein
MATMSLRMRPQVAKFANRPKREGQETWRIIAQVVEKELSQA